MDGSFEIQNHDPLCNNQMAYHMVSCNLAYGAQECFTTEQYNATTFMETLANKLKSGAMHPQWV